MLQSEAGEPAPVVDSPFCGVAAPELHVEGSSAIVSANVEFKPAFVGPHGVFVQAIDQKGRSSRLELFGAWEGR